MCLTGWQLRQVLLCIQTLPELPASAKYLFRYYISPPRWSHQFSEAGLYPIIVTMTTGTTVESLILVQEDITGLQLTGPRIVKIEK